jgi:cellulose synthase/poly-beta-1,6-N-acetylglucosamine synthase-like glycosyltransferase
MPRLSIIIVTYNSAGHIDGCLRSLVDQRPHIDHEIVVVDNASTDATAAGIRTRWNGVRVIDAGANLGFARREQSWHPAVVRTTDSPAQSRHGRARRGRRHHGRGSRRTTATSPSSGRA